MASPGPDLRSMFCQALDRPTARAQAEFLDQACQARPELRSRVEALLRAHREGASFLGEPTSSIAVSVEEIVRERPGTMIGPYKLLEQIGEGGMGLVYLAEQQQPIKRRVALKIIKPGMDSRQVVARFEAERQALALMDHANIAKVHDGGTTPDGRPYFVMELVRGLPITSYCDQHRLTTRQRLALFVDVCHAIQHAHQKGIIHRDLKPSNVMVSLHDVTPVVKVIDFGIAKATGGRLTDKTVHTAFAQMVGTPLYMSPEQAGLSDLDVDTRSDIYSLGVLLFELLTGTTPCDSETLKKAGYDEMRRIIREDEPPRLSGRLSTLAQAHLSTIAERRGLESRRLIHQMKGELDWIVMKALEKDRNRRYESASAFAADVVRFLNDEAVQACPPSASYRFRKFVRRNRNRLAAAALLLAASLLLVCILGVVYFQNAHRLRQRAQEIQQSLEGARTAIEAGDLGLAQQRVAEAEGRLGAERSNLPSLATDVDRIGDEIAARQGELARYQKFLRLASDAQDKMSRSKDLGGEPLAEEALALYGILAEDEWLSGLQKAYLTETQKQQIHETAYVLLVSLADFGVRWWGEEPHSTSRSMQLLARAEAFHEPTRAFYFVRSECYRRQGNRAAADAEVQRYKVAVARTAWDYYLPGHTAGWGGDLEEAIRSYRAALALQPDHYNSMFFLASRLATDKMQGYAEAIGLHTGCIALRPDDPNAYLSRGTCHLKLGQLDEAEADYSAGIAAAANENQRFRACLVRLNFYRKVGRTAKAQEESLRLVEVSKQVLEEKKARLGPEHGSTLESLNILLAAYKEAGRLQDAVPLLEQMLKKRKAELGPDHERTLQTMHNLAAAYKDAGRLEDAIAMSEPVLEKLKATLGPDHEGTIASMSNLAEAYQDVGRPHDAIPLLEQALERRRDPFGFDNEDTHLANMDRLALAYLDAGKLDKADLLLRELLPRRRKKDGSNAAKTGVTLATMGANQLKQQKFAAAEPVLRECLAIHESTLPDDWRRYYALSMLGEALLGQKKYSDAEPLLMHGYEGLKQRENQILAGYKDSRLSEAAERLVRLYEAIKQPEKAAAWRKRLKENQPKK